MGVQWFALWGAPHVMQIQTLPTPYLGTLGLMKTQTLCSQSFFYKFFNSDHDFKNLIVIEFQKKSL
jgi:hypothetical protein